MGLFVIDGEYDFAVHVSPTLSENILNEKYVDPATIFRVDVLFEQEPFITAHVDLEYFKRIGTEPFSSVSIDSDDDESIGNRFFNDLTVTPSKALNAYMKKIKYFT